jgi:hypothetical protein
MKLGLGRVKAAIGSKLVEKPAPEHESIDKTHHIGDHQTIPCPGITEVNNPCLPIYLCHTGVLGGGA